MLTRIISRHLFVSVGLWSVLTGYGETALSAVPACQEDVASICLQNALASINPSSCNWFLLVPALQNCVTQAVNGCTMISIDQWTTIINQFNSTLNAGDCAPTCPQPQTSFSNMLQCYSVTDPLNGEVSSLNSIISSILSSPTPSGRNCNLLRSTITCLTNATNGCSALTDIANQQLVLWNSSLASAACNVQQFQAATTNSPLAILQSISTTASTTTTLAGSGGVVVFGGGSNNTLAVSWIVLIALGGALIVVIVILIVCLVKNTAHTNKMRRLITEEDASASVPNNVLKSSPGWRYKASKLYVGNNMDAALKPSIFRRDFMR